MSRWHGKSGKPTLIELAPGQKALIEAFEDGITRIVGPYDPEEPPERPEPPEQPEPPEKPPVPSEGQYVDARAYGGHWDGNGDDRAAIERALQDIRSGNTDSRTLLLPPLCKIRMKNNDAGSEMAGRHGVRFDDADRVTILGSPTRVVTTDFKSGRNQGPAFLICKVTNFAMLDLHQVQEKDPWGSTGEAEGQCGLVTIRGPSRGIYIDRCSSTGGIISAKLESADGTKSLHLDPVEDFYVSVRNLNTRYGAALKGAKRGVLRMFGDATSNNARPFRGLVVSGTLEDAVVHTVFTGGAAQQYLMLDDNQTGGQQQNLRIARCRFHVEGTCKSSHSPPTNGIEFRMRGLVATGATGAQPRYEVCHTVFTGFLEGNHSGVYCTTEGDSWAWQSGTEAPLFDRVSFQSMRISQASGTSNNETAAIVLGPPNTEKRPANYRAPLVRDVMIDDCALAGGRNSNLGKTGQVISVANVKGTLLVSGCRLFNRLTNPGRGTVHVRDSGGDGQVLLQNGLVDMRNDPASDSVSRESASATKVIKQHWCRQTSGGTIGDPM